MDNSCEIGKLSKDAGCSHSENECSPPPAIVCYSLECFSWSSIIIRIMIIISSQKQISFHCDTKVSQKCLNWNLCNGKTACSRFSLGLFKSDSQNQDPGRGGWRLGYRRLNTHDSDTGRRPFQKIVPHWCQGTVVVIHENQSLNRTVPQLEKLKDIEPNDQQHVL